jgi:hypothetical protein
VFFILSAVFPPSGGASGGSSFSAAVFGSPAKDDFYKNMSRSSQPPPAKDDVPDWVLIVSVVMALAGGVLYLLGPNGVSVRTVTTFCMMPGGLVFYLIAKVIYGGAAARWNVLRSGLAFVGLGLIFAGFMTWVLVLAGNFAPGVKLFYQLAGVAALLGGIALAYYGIKYQQSSEGLAIGRELGFTEADGGVFGADGVYDAKGAVNGVEVLFNVEQEERYKHSPAHFRLEVLCRCANPRGARLEVSPEGFLDVNLSGLPKLTPPAGWDNYNVMSDSPDVVLGPLAAVKAGESVFSGQAGFSKMKLDGGNFEFVFEMEGHAGTAYVRRVLQEVSRLAAAFN